MHKTKEMEKALKTVFLRGMELVKKDIMECDEEYDVVCYNFPYGTRVMNVLEENGIVEMVDNVLYLTTTPLDAINFIDCCVEMDDL